MSDLTIRQQNNLASVIASVLPLRQDYGRVLDALSVVVAQMLADERERSGWSEEGQR